MIKKVSFAWRGLTGVIGLTGVAVFGVAIALAAPVWIVAGTSMPRTLAKEVNSPAVRHQSPVLVPQFGSGTPKLTVIGTARDGLSVPRDLAFHPERPHELWVVNQAIDGTVIYFDPGTAEQRSEKRVDRFASHFMADVSAIAFGARNTFATCQESRNGADMAAKGNDFMGPTLWSADLDIYARVNQRLADLTDFQVQMLLNGMLCMAGSPDGVPVGVGRSRPDGARAVPDQGLLGSHIDMNHESPWCVGIAHDHANVYWVADGFSGNVVRYDFVKDHGPGNEDHSDAIIRRYPAAELTRVPGVPSHMQLDAATGWLYFVDTGSAMVRRLDTRTGAVARRLKVREEKVAEYSEVQDSRIETFIDSGLRRPSGLALNGETLFVSDNANGQIVAYALDDGRELARLKTDAKGIMGLTIGPDSKLWYVDGDANTLVRIDPDGATLPTATAVPTEPPPTTAPDEPTPTTGPGVPPPSASATLPPATTLAPPPTVTSTLPPTTAPTLPSSVPTTTPVPTAMPNKPATLAPPTTHKRVWLPRVLRAGR